MIKVEIPKTDKLNQVLSWPVWEKEPSEFDWDYTEKEEFYILEGSARLESECGLKAEISIGDLVTVDQGLLIKWTITEPLRKHYKFY